MVIVQLCGIVVHDLVGDLEGIMMLKFGFDIIIWVLVRMLINKQIFDCAFTDRSLVDSKTCGKLPVLSKTNLVQKIWPTLELCRQRLLSAMPLIVGTSEKYNIPGGRFVGNESRLTHCKVLTIIVDQIVSWPFIPHVEDDHFACGVEWEVVSHGPVWLQLRK